MKQVIVTERLFLRPWLESDAESLYEYAKDKDVGLPTGWLPHKSVTESRDIIKRILSIDGNYALCLNSDNKAIGCVGFKEPGTSLAKEGDLEIGFWIGKPFWGNGYVPEAVKALLEYAFKELGCPNVWCAYYEGNEKSRRCQEKCGFIYHHTEKDVPAPLIGGTVTKIYSLLSKEEWQQIS